MDRLILNNFKNYREADVQFCGNVNCFVGNNGAGKTNLLDAVYYLSFCKSYFNPIDIQNILVGEDYFAIHGHYGDDMASCILRRGQGKQMRWNKKACKTLAEHIGRLPLVMVSPGDQSLITGGSEGRRKFVDGILSQTDHVYLDHLIQYTKALDQRNRLLKQMWEDRLWDEGMVSVWDEQLCRHGEPLLDARRRFIEDFLPLFAEYYHWIAGEGEPGSIEYVTDPRPLDQQIGESRQADKYSQYTNAGPHKDDLQFMLGGEMTVKRFGSQGQQRTAALSLKLAEIELVRQKINDTPVLLLDDVLSELDSDRQERLLGSLAGVQTFLSCTGLDDFIGRAVDVRRKYRVEENKVEEITNE